MRAYAAGWLYSNYLFLIKREMRNFEKWLVLYLRYYVSIVLFNLKMKTKYEVSEWLVGYNTHYTYTLI